MENQIAISYPETLAFSLKMKSKEFEREMKAISLIKLYELGKISSGIAGRILGISRLEFLKLLPLYGVSYFSTDDLLSDAANA
jgi:predicted HTH domain antitoxin